MKELTQQTKTLEGGKAMKRGEFTYAVKTRKELPENAKPARLILHIIKKERWDCWNELLVYDYGNDEEVIIISDRNYFRVPDPEEKYYFYFYTYAEDKPDEYEWYYVRVAKGATSIKGSLSWSEAKEYIKRWIKGEIYKIEHITEEGEKLLDFLKLKKLELDGVRLLCEEEVFYNKKEIYEGDTYVIVFENTTISKLNNDDTMFYVRLCKGMSVIVVRSKNPTYPIDKETQHCNLQMRYYPGCYDGYFIEIYEVKQEDLLNTALKQVKSKTEFSLIPLVK